MLEVTLNDSIEAQVLGMTEEVPTEGLEVVLGEGDGDIVTQ